MTPPKSTPMIQQYLSIKGQYPDAILFFRMGDFYEMFFEDAQLAARVLDITLTSRNKNDDTPVPMCGVPCKAAQGYIARLIGTGHKVAVCEQVEDPATAKGLVKREVVRVISPGMVVENEMLDAKTGNFIMAVSHTTSKLGIAYLDISTGDFRVSETDAVKTVLAENRRIFPKELILADSARNVPQLQPIVEGFREAAVTYIDDAAFDPTRARKVLLRQFDTISLDGYGCENLKAAVSAAGALIHHVSETQKQKIEHIYGVETYSLNDYLWLDDITIRNLELFKNISTGSQRGTLIGVIDRTKTAMGGRLLRHWLCYPLRDQTGIERRLAAVQDAKDNRMIRQQLRTCLDSVFDLERLGSKITMGHCNARDLVALKQSLLQIPAICVQLELLKTPLYRWPDATDELSTLADLIDHAIRDDAPPTLNEGGIIKAGYSEALDELVQISRDAKSWLARLELDERQATGINTLKVRYNKVFGYYIEVPKSRSESVPVHYVRKQTLVNSERYITEALKDFELKALNAEEQRCKIEHDLFEQVRRQVIRTNAVIQRAARFIARLDCLLGFAEVSDQNDYRRPSINIDGHLILEESRHPVIEQMITAERFVPNSISMDNQAQQMIVITGPNMAGKSTVLRQVVLAVVLAHAGCFVPARKADICVTDRIFSRVGALDNLALGQSTFMVEMQETANILNNASARSLVILDEIGRGTSTFDGLSIAWAVAEYLHDLRGSGVKTLFATHYHELTELAKTKDRVKNCHIAVKEWNDRIIFLRKLVEGGTNRSYGIQVARLAGIPPAVLQRAKKVLAAIENGELHLNVPAASKGDADPSRLQVQLDLFRQMDPVTAKLNQIDIVNTTPLEALNHLNELLDLSKSISR